MLAVGLLGFSEAGLLMVGADNFEFSVAKSKKTISYHLFGQVIEGMDVVHKIEKVKTGNRGMHQDVPVEPVVIHSLRVLA